LSELPDEALRELAPALIVAVVWSLGLFLSWWLLLGRAGAQRSAAHLARQMAMVGLGLFALISVVYALPLSDAWRQNLPGLIGLGLSALVGLASTTLVANVMAGLMLRVVGSFHSGDFIRVEQHFGRVTEQGLLHTEIQTEDRDLVTLPNVFVISNPVRVVRGSGTIISADLSLGYDVDHATVEPLLAAAARTSGLEDPFVHVLELGDFSVNYRVAGFLPNPKQLITTRSILRGNVLDTLHRAGIEIVSPTFMNQRVYAAETQVIPVPSSRRTRKADEVRGSESLVFDKADAVERLDELKEERRSLEQAISGETPGAEDSENSADAVRELARLRAELTRCQEEIAALETEAELD
jgi:small-conductance mechanosensitive channel